MAFPAAAAAAIPYIAQGVSMFVGGKQGKKAQKRQFEHNMQLAQFQADANRQYLNEQLAYNTPAAQMARWKEAGLNPHLAYGQGTPGNQNSPLEHPNIQPSSYEYMNQIIPLGNQTALASSQAQAQNAQTRQRTVMTEVAKVQKRVLEANPLLNTEAFNATIDSLKAAAELKASEAGQSKMLFNWMSQRSYSADGNAIEVTYKGYQKMDAELALLDQRFKLGEADKKIKAEVLNSKEFQNAILEVQKKFMVDADFTPQHMVMFIQMLLMKLL